MDREKENGLMWTRLVLEVYNKLPQMARTFEKAGDNLVKSSLTSGRYGLGYTTEEIFEKMIELNYRKTGIINLKVLTDQSLRRIDTSYANVLKARYFLKLDYATIAQKENTTQRTVFRKVERGIEKLCESFAFFGFTASRFEREYADEPLIQREKTKILERLSNENQDYSKSS